MNDWKNHKENHQLKEWEYEEAKTKKRCAQCTTNIPIHQLDNLCPKCRKKIEDSSAR